MVDPIDEYVFTQLAKFDGKHKLTNIAREGLKLPGEKKEDDEDKVCFQKRVVAIVC